MFKNLSIKNRIAIFYSISFSVILLIILGLIYLIVNNGINKTMYESLEDEIDGHINYVLQEPTFTSYVAPREWEEIEHTDISLNPVFISIYDTNFNLVENSPNLVQSKLLWKDHQKDKKPYYAYYKSIEMLISQAKLIHHGEVVGYVVVGISTKHNQLALSYLQKALVIIFPISILIIFFITQFIASKSIEPVFNIIQTAQSISENNLSERIILHKNKDELHQLSVTINSLLDRLEFQLIRAKQFSADASHELRTPLAIIKGTLEILIRKERTQEEYNEKINYTLKQVERLYRLVEQFLLFSRVENHSLDLDKTSINVKNEILTAINRFDILLNEKQIQIKINQLTNESINSYKEVIEIIIDNILSNAIKYSKLNGIITISSNFENSYCYIIFEDNGIGISENDLELIKNRFFRTQDQTTLNISGSGLGLNIATKFAEIIGGKIIIESKKGQGTKVILKIKKNLED
ncbi:HAMP domain-containing sensor histidine kinase [Chishuiella sp.]|uniref:sensor histidine kinase n=1 Tax=Chishuiella sp. TaxID=1969467 RepID=UPI0028A8711F|nr:HAMP domain-containing sensor histidine kinase [Chishuiella sp.]